MKRTYLGLAFGALVAVGALLSLPSCGHDQQLMSITIIPTGETITGTGVIVPFMAQGNYIHPPEIRDITNSVVWASTAPQIISIIAATGVATTGDGCGTNITITATAYANPQNHSGRAVVGTAPVSVAQPGGTCP